MSSFPKLNYPYSILYKIKVQALAQEYHHKKHQKIIDTYIYRATKILLKTHYTTTNTQAYTTVNTIRYTFVLTNVNTMV